MNLPEGLCSGRKYSDGLHQAQSRQKKESSVEHESKTLATITFQNYFRMYKLAGMTGTAETEEEEFRKIYGLTLW